MRGLMERYGPMMMLMLLGLQGAVLLWAMDRSTATIFCTGGEGWLPVLYSALHLGFAAMMVLGAAALRWPGLRLAYATALAIGLVVLMFQPSLVASGRLTCDLPGTR